MFIKSHRQRTDRAPAALPMALPGVFCVCTCVLRNNLFFLLVDIEHILCQALHPREMQASWVQATKRTCIRTIIIPFFSSGTSLGAHTFVRNVGWCNPTVGVTLTEVWARFVQCIARGKPFQLFLALGTLKANPRVSATSPGIGFLHPLSPCTHVRFGCKPGFSARRGYTYIPYFCTEHHATILPSCRPTAVQPLTAGACRSTRVWLLL